MNTFTRLLVTVFTAFFIASCSGNDDKAELPPMELLKFKQTLNLKKVWSAKVGDGSELLRLMLAPAGDGTNVYTASLDGIVSAFEPASGKRVWRVELEVPLSAGPGVGERLVVVAGRDGDVVALNPTTGAEVWRADVIGESLSRPLVTTEGVVIYTIDGRLRVLSLIDGSERWSVQQDLPLLTLRGSSSPIIIGGNIVIGFDNGRLVALDADTGNTEWESMISPPSGRSDLERLSDIDGKLQFVGQDIYASGYNGRVLSMAGESGQILWAREISSYVGTGADWNHVYVASSEGEILALQRRNGADVWRSDTLLRREPTAPVSFGQTVVAGDFEGYVHFFNAADGKPVARVRVGKGPLSDAPVVIGNQLYVQSENGQLDVFEVAVPKPEKGKDKPAADEKT